MITARQRLLELIKDMPEPDVEEVLYFLEHIKEQQGMGQNKELADSGEIKIDYWDSDIDDEVWKEL